MTSGSRSSSYSCEEDIHLCRVYLDLVTGINQSKEQLWIRIVESYNNSKPPRIQERNKRSLQCRMQVILQAFNRLRGCITQIEHLNPSGGASEYDTLIQAKELMMQDITFKKGFKFDHVWHILKDMEKVPPTGNRRVHKSFPVENSSQSETQETNPPVLASPGLSSFELNLSDENFSGGSSQKSLGLKNSKMKKKKEENCSQLAEVLRNDRQEFLEILKQGSSDRQQSDEIQLERLKQNRQIIERDIYHDDTKILLMDLNSIEDPSLRENFRMEQRRILQKRREMQRERDD